MSKSVKNLAKKIEQKRRRLEFEKMQLETYERVVNTLYQNPIWKEQLMGAVKNMAADNETQDAVSYIIRNFL